MARRILASESSERLGAKDSPVRRPTSRAFWPQRQPDREAQNRPMVAPGLAYYLLTVGGIIVSLAIIAATFPILTRITGPEVTRND